MISYVDLRISTVDGIKEQYDDCDEQAFRNAYQTLIKQPGIRHSMVKGVILMVDALVYDKDVDKSFCTRMLFNLLHYLHQQGYKEFVYITEAFVFSHLKIT